MSSLFKLVYLPDLSVQRKLTGLPETCQNLEAG